MHLSATAIARALVGALALLGLASCASAGTTVSTPVETLPPRPEDVASIDGMMKAFYAVVNVAPDAPRQWSRDRTLYPPWIRFVAVGSPSGGRPTIEVMTHQELVDASEPLVREGFSEREIFRTTKRYGAIAHVDSTYETLIGKAKPVRSRGVNSIEMYFDGQRWWMVSVIWQTEDAAHPLPPEYLPPPGQTSRP
jgi:hypothetical protein